MTQITVSSGVTRLSYLVIKGGRQQISSSLIEIKLTTVLFYKLIFDISRQSAASYLQVQLCSNLSSVKIFIQHYVSTNIIFLCLYLIETFITINWSARLENLLSLSRTCSIELLLAALPRLRVSCICLMIPTIAYNKPPPR